jgi:molybdopterin adenylyltransferase
VVRSASRPPAIACAAREIVRDEAPLIEAHLRRWIADPAVDCVITTGGTGITGRDVTPEAFARVLEKEIEGFGELFRMLSYRRSAPPRSSRAPSAASPAAPTCSRCRARTGACKDAWDDILLFQLDSRHRPCNLVELMPRLQEHLIAEELTQALGLADDSRLVRDSIFNDASARQRIAPWDALMVRILYDPRLRPGMHKTEAMPIVRRIIAEHMRAGATSSRRPR